MFSLDFFWRLEGEGEVFVGWVEEGVDARFVAAGVEAVPAVGGEVDGVETVEAVGWAGVVDAEGADNRSRRDRPFARSRAASR